MKKIVKTKVSVHTKAQLHAQLVKMEGRYEHLLVRYAKRGDEIIKLKAEVVLRKLEAERNSIKLSLNRAKYDGLMDAFKTLSYST